MSDLIQRCREYGFAEHPELDGPERRTLRDAADEIERLRAEIIRLEARISEAFDDGHHAACEEQEMASS